MKRIYSVLVENHSGVLCKVAGLALTLIHLQLVKRRTGTFPA